MGIKRVVFHHREGLRWYFVDTTTWKIDYFISLNIKDIKFILNGIHLLLPPTNIKHIKFI